MSAVDAIIDVMYDHRPSAVINSVNLLDFTRGADLHPTLPNVAWMSDVRAQQVAYRAWRADNLARARRFLAADRARYARIDAFLAPGEAFANQVMTWLGGERPWHPFMCYPRRREITGWRRFEVVYIDHARTLRKPYFQALAELMQKVKRLTGAPGLIVSRYHARGVSRCVREYGVFVKPEDQYDALSQFGLLVNVDGFADAIFALPRKLAKYLHYGIVPLIHATWHASWQYLADEGLPPLAYRRAGDIPALMDAVPEEYGRADRDRFCIEKRAGEILEFFERVKRGKA